MVTYEPLHQLKQAGMRAICMGIQANDRINDKYYHRPVKNAQILEAQRVFRQVGIQANLQREGIQVLIRTCEKGKDLLRGWQLFDGMQLEGTTPDANNYSLDFPSPR